MTRPTWKGDTSSVETSATFSSGSVVHFLFSTLRAPHQSLHRPEPLPVPRLLGLEDRERFDVAPGVVEPSCLDRAGGGEFPGRGVVGVHAGGSFPRLEGDLPITGHPTETGDLEREGRILDASKIEFDEVRNRPGRIVAVKEVSREDAMGIGIDRAGR
jgi:hypothetical protein